MKYALYIIIALCSLAIGQRYPGRNLLEDLDDVNISAPDTASILIWDGEYWKDTLISFGSDTVTYSYHSDSSRYADSAGYAPASPDNSKWIFRITDTADTTLQMVGSWGVYRYGNYATGTGDSTQYCMGVTCSTGSKYSISAWGYGNYASENYATVSGGYRCKATGQYTVVAGGRQNVANSLYACVSGGRSNTASNSYATVSGGITNTASGNAATVAGGDNNTASGGYSSTIGGSNNTAVGAYSGVYGGLHNTTGDATTDTLSSVYQSFYSYVTGKKSHVFCSDSSYVTALNSAIWGGSNDTLAADSTYQWGGKGMKIKLGSNGTPFSSFVIRGDTLIFYTPTDSLKVLRIGG